MCVESSELCHEKSEMDISIGILIKLATSDDQLQGIFFVHKFMDTQSLGFYSKFWRWKPLGQSSVAMVTRFFCFGTSLNVGQV